MKAYVFPGQGAQFVGMAKPLYDEHQSVKFVLHLATEILGFDILKTMFEGPEEELKQTAVTQPAIFLHSMALVTAFKDRFKPDMVAGHSLGELSALAATEVLSFEDALNIVKRRAEAMQKACEQNPSTMAAILGMDNEKVVEVCQGINEVVVAANFNSPGQVVISGSNEGVQLACEALKVAGAKRALPLKVGGAFHSPLMQPAESDLEQIILQTEFIDSPVPIYQNVNAKATKNAAEIQQNLIRQLTAPVLWTQTVEAMLADGATEFVEVGPGKVLQGLVKKVNRKIPTASIEG